MYVVRHEYFPVNNKNLNVVVFIGNFIDCDFFSVHFDRFLFFYPVFCNDYMSRCK